MTGGPDLLLRHESADPAMLGVLTLSAYSLQAGELSASATSPTAIVFPDDDSKGLYNATTALMSCLEKPGAWCARKINATPSSVRLPADLSLIGFQPGAQGAYSSPVIHLDALGRTGFSQVAILPVSESWLPQQDLFTRASGNTQKSAGGTGLSLPNSWKMLTVVVLGCMAFFTLCLWRASITSAFESEILLAPADADEEVFHGVKRRNLIMLLACVSCAVLVMVVWPVLSASDCRIGDFCFYLLATLFVGCGLSAVIAHRFPGRIRFAPAVLCATCALVCAATSREVQTIDLRRYVAVGSQISPLLPLFFLGLSGIWWLWYNIAACVLTDSRRPRVPKRGNQMEIPGDISAEGQISLELAMKPGYLDRRIWIPAVALTVFTFLFAGPNPLLSSMEGEYYDWLMTLLLVVSFAFLLESVLRILVVWTEAKHLLRGLNNQPFRTKIARVGGITWSSIWKVGIASVSIAHSLFVRQVEAIRLLEAQLLRGRRAEFRGEKSYQLLASIRGRLVAWLRLEEAQTEETNPDLEVSPDVRSQLVPGLQISSVWNLYEDLLKMRRSPGCQNLAGFRERETALLQAYSELQARFALSATYLLKSLNVYYSCHPEINCELDAESLKEAQQEAPATCREIAEHFVSMIYINYIVTILLRIRALAVAAAGIFVFDVLALNSYPFEPRAVLRALMIGILIAITACFALVYSQMHRDPILSRMTDTRPGELGGDFWLRMLSVTGLPIVSLLATEFPAIGNFLFSWIEPFMKAAH